MGDVTGADIILKNTLEDSAEKDDLRKTIRELSSRVRAIYEPGHSNFIIIDELNKLKEKVVESSTPNEKGKTLENLASYLFCNINGIKEIRRRHRLEAEEIDIILSNAAFPPWGDPIIVECKNWSNPVSKSEVVDFIDKVKTMGATTGIIVTIKGVTGDYYKDAKKKISDALRDEKIHILVITWEDIEKIRKAEDWIEIVRDRFYLPTDF